MSGSSATASYRYKAFISYSHAADDRLAPALRDGLHGFAKPWYRLRAMDVFRDETGLGVTPALWPKIQAALVASEYFLLLASPDAAASEWVQREVNCWLESRSSDHLLIALTRGEIHWDDTARDFDWSRTDALPRRLSKALADEPKFIDLRWARTATDLSLRNPDFLTAVAGIASTLQDRPLDELVGEDVRQHRRARRAAAAAIIALATATASAIGFAGYAHLQRSEARRQEQIAIQEKQVAVEQRDEARRRLVQLSAANGQRAADSGDVSAAMLWFARTTGLEADHPTEQDLLRERLASLAGRHAALRNVWRADVSLGAVGFTADGAWVLGYPRDEGGVQAWNAETGSVAFAPLDSAVVDVASTAQGPRLLTIDAEGAHVWDSRSRQRVTSLRHDTPVSWASFVSEGRLVLTLADDRTARLWDAVDGHPVLALADVHEIFDAAIDGDAVTLLVRNRGGEPAAWSNRTRKRIAFDDHKAQNAELSADRRSVLLFDDDASASVWGATSGRQLTDLGRFEWVDHARFSPDGQRVAMVSRDGWATVWDIASNRELRTVRHQGAVLDAAFSPDGKWLATTSTDQQARVWNIETGEDVIPPLWHESTVVRVAFSPDGAHLATTTSNELVRLWALPAVYGVTLPHSESVRTAAFSPDGRHVLTATNFTAQLWDTAGNTDRATFVWAPGSQLYHASFTPDGAFAVTASEDGLARLWDVQTGKQAAAFPHDRRVRYAAFSRDGKQLLTSSNLQLLVWDASTLPQVASKPKLSLAHDSPVIYGEFSPDGREILAVEFGGTARVWNLATGQERTELRRSDITLARLSPDGTRLATAGDDRIVRLWDTASGAQVAETLPHEYRMTDLAFSADGRRVATASEGSVRIWDTASGTAVTPPMQHAGRVMRVAFSPDGTSIVTASEDRTARVWNAVSGDPISEPLQHAGVVRDAAFSPDGQHVVTAAEDRTARLWSLSSGGLTPEEWTRRAQLLAARRIDDTGAVVSLPADQFLALWRQ